jgi:hypothetical protein
MSTKRPDWKPTFLEAFRNSANVRASCQAAGISRQHAYRTRDRNARFAAAWKEAEDEAVDTLVATAWKRARESSDTLLIFLLKCHRREVYGDTSRHELANAPDQPLGILIHMTEAPSAGTEVD